MIHNKGTRIDLLMVFRVVSGNNVLSARRSLCLTVFVVSSVRSMIDKF